MHGHDYGHAINTQKWRTLMLKITVSSPRGDLRFETEVTANETIEDIKNYIVERMAENEDAIKIYRLNDTVEIKDRLVILYNGKKISDRIPVSILNTTGCVSLQFDVKRRYEESISVVDSDAVEYGSIRPTDIQYITAGKIAYRKVEDVQYVPADIREMDGMQDDRICFDDGPLSNSSLNNEENDVEMQQIERNVVVRNLITGKKMAVDPRKVVRRNGKLFYLSSQDACHSENIFRRIERMLSTVPSEVVLRASIIFALLYNGSYSMASILIFIFSLMFLSELSCLQLSFDCSSRVEMVGKLVYSFVASMFLLSFESSAI